MSPSLLETRRVRPTRPNCARASTSTGSRLRSDARLKTNFVVDHPRVPAVVEPMAGAELPVLSELFLLYTYRDRTIRSLTRVVARPAPPPTLSPLQQGRLR